jgi:Cof subfamily protein (haloacid dehalogenase superfamily)
MYCGESHQVSSDCFGNLSGRRSRFFRIMSNPVLTKYKLAAIDLDDTLLAPDKSISSANKQAVEDLRSAGIHVVLASGRTAESMQRYYDELGLTGPMITNNGAFVKDPAAEEVLLRIALPADLAGRVINGGLERGFSVVCSLEGEVFASEESPWVNLYESRTGRRDVRHHLPENVKERQIVKIIWLSSPDRILNGLSSARELFADSLNYMITEPEYVEFMEKRADKSTGVKTVADFYGVSQAEVLAFGDNNNDVGMLRWAGAGIAVGNGSNSAKNAADFVGPPGREDSFARALAAFSRSSP